MRRLENKRIQSFRMQSQHCIRGMKWYDKIVSAAIMQRTKLPDLPHLIADRHHSIFGHVCRLSKTTPNSLACYLSVDALLLRTGSAHWVAHGDYGCSNQRRHRFVYQICRIHKRGSLVVAVATTLSWSTTAVSDWHIRCLDWLWLGLRWMVECSTSKPRLRKLDRFRAQLNLYMSI